MYRSTKELMDILRMIDCSADPLDRAAALSQAYLEVSLSRIKKFEGVSAHECVECGAEIPKKRRELLQGVTDCVDCAAIKETLSKNYMR
jgi:phage/conjugal plasmid C-4 type zinc finger TraR family protein